ncbi:MAG: hypothetical protein DA328_05885, partial [Nitrososphaeraceae archaeon]|nr:hypothetical protein [Nitrososphaeraceae archaeon]
SFFIFSILVFSFDHEKYDSRGFLANQSKSITLKDQSLISEMVYTGIEFPTSMAFLKENDILVLEKNTGTVKRIIDKQIVEKPLIDLNVATGGERGLLGIAVDNYTQNLDEAKYVFLYLTESRESDGEDTENNVMPIGNRVYRYELLNGESELLNPKLLIDLPAGPKSMHNGGKIVIGPDKNLYFIVGDMGIDRSLAINDKKGTAMDGRAGILRITQNGDTVKDDFQLGKKHPLNKYYAYGIRNGFGLDFDPVTGNLWDSEIGPEFGDEINLVKPGFNGGWNQVQGIWETTGYNPRKIILNPTDDLVVFNNLGKYIQPKLALYDGTGFTAIKFFDSDKLGNKYENTLFLGDFHTGKLYNFQLDEERNSLLLDREKNSNKIFLNQTDLDHFLFAEGFGGIVDIQVSPEGYLHVLSLYYGGDNCFSKDEIHGKDCVNYSSDTPGTIFKIKTNEVQ